MKKTLNINIGSTIFHIEEDAYNKLNSYLDVIASHFSNEEGKDEILADIESRIAEMLQERLEKHHKSAIQMDDVDIIIGLMGKPEDFESEREEVEDTSAHYTSQKQFFRNPDNKILGGVCSGISAYFDIDPIWLRLAFVLSWFIWGFGFLLYIIFWIVIPEAKTAAEKLKMKGKRVNLSNIEKTVKEEMEHLKRRIDDLSSKKNTNKAKNFIESLVDLVISIIKLSFKIIIKIVGFVLIFTGSVAILAIILGILSAFGIVSWFYPFFLPAFFHSGLYQIIGVVGFTLLVGIPFMAILIKGLQILFDIKMNLKGFGIGIFALWILGLIMIGIVSVQAISDFSKKGKVKTNIHITQPDNDILYLDLSKKILEKDNIDEDIFGYDSEEVCFGEVDGQLAIAQVKLDIVKSESTNFELLQINSARGKSKDEAKKIAESIIYNVTQNDTILTFDPYLQIGPGSKWRHQQIELMLKVPVGKRVYLGKNMAHILYDVDNITNTYDRKMVGHQWIMLNKGLACTTCDNEDKSSKLSNYYNINTSVKYPDFDKVDINGPFEVQIIQGNEFLVSNSGSSEAIDDMDLRVVSHTLKADYDRSFWEIFKFKNKEYIRLDIIIPELESASFAGICKAYVKGFEQDEITIDISGVSNVKADIQVKNIDLDISGVSKVTISGEANFLNSDISGASTLQGYNLDLLEADIDLSGACNAYVYVIDRLSAEVSGASNVTYKGNPTVNSDISGASSIKQKH